MTEPSTVQRKWDLDRLVRVLLTAGTVFGLFLLLRYLADVLIPFAIALLLAFLLNPIVTTLNTRLGRRPVAVFITVAGCGIVGAAFAIMLTYVGTLEVASLRELTRELVRPPVGENVSQIRLSFDKFVDAQTNPTVKGVLEDLRMRMAPDAAIAEAHREAFDAIRARPFDANDRVTLDWVAARLEQQSASEMDLPGLAKRAIRFVAPSLVGFFTGTLSFVLGLTGLIVVLLYLVFLLIDYPELSAKWRNFLPPKYRGDIIGFVEEFHLAMSRYFRGQFIIALIVGVLFAIGFKLLGLRLAILLGLGIGALNMVPYLQALGLIPALLLGLVKGLETGQSVWLPPLLVLVVFAVVQVIQDALLTPKIMGKSVGLRPFVLMLSVFVWGKLLGFLGLVLAIPLTCLGLAYYKRFVLGDRKAQVVGPE